MGLLAIYLLPAAAAFFLFLKTLTDYRGLRARHFIPFIPSIIYAILLQIVSVLVYAIFLSIFERRSRALREHPAVLNLPSLLQLYHHGVTTREAGHKQQTRSNVVHREVLMLVCLPDYLLNRLREYLNRERDAFIVRDGFRNHAELMALVEECPKTRRIVSGFEAPELHFSLERFVFLRKS